MSNLNNIGGQMDNKNQMQIGTWDKISTADNNDRIKFEVNLTVGKIFVKIRQKPMLFGDKTCLFICF